MLDDDASARIPPVLLQLLGRLRCLRTQPKTDLLFLVFISLLI